MAHENLVHFCMGVVIGAMLILFAVIIMTPKLPIYFENYTTTTTTIQPQMHWIHQRIGGPVPNVTPCDYNGTNFTDYLQHCELTYLEQGGVCPIGWSFVQFPNNPNALAINYTCVKNVPTTTVCDPTNSLPPGWCYG